ncbi:CpaF family protein [Acetohalobium arabaticum]|uniref:Type II secretion system protein E n=1 Tax=Acetohalobium arabaticum (strain ATCC 49924 / DSM 5501 / Z-7288) TaxID=574087 RepID=D9QTM2_ACEAZ|nr:CpaF family protein [Acetohalobium arabaticum]ADL11786.1 type II secretion system protein E [Acetohalobium arabaticum DSM 5501]
MSLKERLSQQKEQEIEPGSETEAANTKTSASTLEEDPYRGLKTKIHNHLLNELELEVLSEDKKEAEDQQLKQDIKDLTQEVIEAEEVHISPGDRRKVIQDIIDEIIGFGPINGLLEDPEVTEVMVNGPDQVYVERDGKLVLTDVRFRDDEHVIHIIEKIVAPLGRRIDESSPMVDARLPDGSRVNAIIPPLALNGPTITIRKFAEDPFTVEDLIGFGTMTEEMAQFLEACVEVRLNIVVAGGTGSGKTTTLNVLSSFIPEEERIVTIEDAAELQLVQDHVVSLETRPPNVEGKGAVTMRELVKNSLRMRPDRIVVGEVRGGEALDMLQAMNTGHDGSLTTGHANSPRDMLSRLETMVMMAGMELPVKAIRDQIASAVDLIVHQSRLRDGSRKIVKVTEVQGMEGEIITLQDIFSFEQEGFDNAGNVQGELKATGIRPKFFDRFKAEGIDLPSDIFMAY